MKKYINQKKKYKSKKYINQKQQKKLNNFTINYKLVLIK